MARRTVEKTKTPQLALRAEPTQARAKQTFLHLLDTAAVLIEEMGVDEFNTNLLAERAGVGIRTIYRYFPNKLSILAALAQHLAQLANDRMDSFDELADPAHRWEDAIDHLIDTLALVNETHTALPALFATLLALPELESVRARIYDEGAKRLADALQQRGVELPERMQQRIAYTLVSSSIALDEAMPRGGSGANELLAEYKLLVRCYLAPIMS